MAELRLLATADEILKISDITYDVVATPEWGDGTGVRVRSLSAREASSYQESLIEERKVNNTIQRVPTSNPEAKARLVATACVTADGARIFSDTQVGVLADKNAAPVNRIWERVLEMSGIKDVDQAKRLGSLAHWPERRFLFRLAGQLGCTVAELGGRLSSAELEEWRAYAEIEPFGDWRRELWSAQILAAFLNAHRDPKKQRDPVEIVDLVGEVFMGGMFKKRPLTSEQLFQKTIDLLFGGKDPRVKD